MKIKIKRQDLYMKIGLSNGSEVRNLNFEVMDTNTGKVITDERIQEIAKNAGNLMVADIDQFAVTEDNHLVLLDECGNYSYYGGSDLVIRQTGNRYPDLDFFENQLYGIILSEFPGFKGNVLYKGIDVEMFPQTWATTAGGFEEPGMVAGQAITTEYTTVMRMSIWLKNESNEHEFFGVFFGNSPAYLVNDPTPQFLEDIKNRNMKSVYEAGNVY